MAPAVSFKGKHLLKARGSLLERSEQPFFIFIANINTKAVHEYTSQLP